ncbi:hypothetical protein LSTR_LSTR016944 [Laodelphax striatellus]|uniref:Uncharacterized protein n=1 Tax=Laodelphax striatellus TaxID=195883 RepID=A0A482XT44_LAOST|nr:hypothetical protein LSTR_LSTR016944 [Laodelphax striatellus]
MEYKGASRGCDNTIQANNPDWTTMQLNQALLIGPHFNIATRGYGVSSSQNNVTENSAATRFSSVRRGSFAEELVEKYTGKEGREKGILNLKFEELICSMWHKEAWSDSEKIERRKKRQKLCVRKEEEKRKGKYKKRLNDKDGGKEIFLEEEEWISEILFYVLLNKQNMR